MQIDCLSFTKTLFCISGRQTEGFGRTSPTRDIKAMYRRGTTEPHCKYRSRAGSFHRYRGPPSSRRKAYKSLYAVRFYVNYDIVLKLGSINKSSYFR